MAIQSSYYLTDGTTRTYPSSKHIASKLHVAVYFQTALTSAWSIVESSQYEVVNNSVVFYTAPVETVYSQIEIRVADTTAELEDSPSDIAIVAGAITDVINVSNNISVVENVNNNMGAITTVSANTTNLNSIVDDVIPNLPEILLADDNASIATVKASEASASATLAQEYAESIVPSSFVKNVDTISDLSTINPTIIGIDNVFVKDFDRGGLFVWSSTGTANGGTVFAGATGYWNRQYSGALNVKWFGAKGDGITDDTPSFIATSLAAKNGETIDLGDSSNNYIVTAASLPVNNLIRWRTDGARVNGAVIFTGFSGEQIGYSDIGREYRIVNDGAILDGRRKENIRYADYTGGNTGELDFLEVWRTYIGANVGSATQRKAEKAGLFEVTNASPYANGIALMLNAMAVNTSATWGLEISTHSTVVPVVFAHRGAEISISGMDDDVNDLRWTLDLPSHGEGGVNDTIGRGINIVTGTAHYRVGMKIYEGNATYKIKDTAIEIDTDASFMNAFSSTKKGQMNLGSKLASGVTFESFFKGGNSIGGVSTYSSISSTIVTNTSGAEVGVFKINAMNAGVLTTVLQAHGGTANSISIRVNNVLKQVSEGVADSGGVGYKLLRVAN